MSNPLVGQTSSFQNVFKGASTLVAKEKVVYIPGGVRLESAFTGANVNIANRIFKIIYQKVGYQVTVQLLAYDSSANPVAAVGSFVVGPNAATLSFDDALLGTKITAQLANDRKFSHQAGGGTSSVGLNAIGGVFQPANVAVLGNTSFGASIGFHITGVNTIPASADPYHVCSASFIAGNANIVV